MIIATYLPLYRVYELELFKKNVEVARAERAVVCVDYFTSEKLKPLVEGYLRDLGVEAELLAGNWQNRSSCVLRLLKLIVEEGGDGLVVDSDNLLPHDFPSLDEKLDLPLYHLSDIPWEHPRVVRRESRGGVEVYYWRVKNVWRRVMHVFAGPKQGMRIKKPVLNVGAIDHVLSVVESMDDLFARVVADEITIGIVYDKSGISEVPFVVATRHLGHSSYPHLGHHKAIRRKIYAMALARLYWKAGYTLPALRYAATALLWGLSF